MANVSPGLGIRHDKVRRLRRLLRQRSARHEQRAFVAEGIEVVRSAFQSGAQVEGVYFAPEAQRRCPELVEQSLEAGLLVHWLDEGVVEKIADTVTPQPVLAVVHRTNPPIATLKDATLVLIAVNVADPGNAGTLLRSAEAAGCSGVVWCAGSVDVTNPKTVRASAGAMFHLPVIEAESPVEVLEMMGQFGLQRLGATAHGGATYHEIDYTLPTALVVGNEAAGIPPEVISALDTQVTIPIAGRSESLNVGMAASIVLFEAVRQRERNV